MVTNFENITYKLTNDELKMAKVIAANLAVKTKENPVKADAIIKGMNNAGYKLTEARLRKIVNLLRSDGVLPIIATSKGYYVSRDKTEIIKQIKSMAERADAILNAAKGLERWTL
jgi:hypothetical protein